MMEVLTNHNHHHPHHHPHRRRESNTNTFAEQLKKDKSDFEKIFNSESIITNITNATQFNDNSARFDAGESSTSTALLSQLHTTRLSNEQFSDENSIAGIITTKKKRNQVLAENSISEQQSTPKVIKEIGSKNMYDLPLTKTEQKEKKHSLKLKETNNGAQTTKQQLNPSNMFQTNGKTSILPKTFPNSIRLESKTKLNSLNIIDTASSTVAPATLNVQKTSQTNEKKTKKSKKSKKTLAKKGSVNSNLGSLGNQDDTSSQLPVEENLNEVRIGDLSTNESIRWENEIEDNPKKEAQRIETYKLNRRKRYMEERNKINFCLATNITVDKQSLMNDDESSSIQADGSVRSSEIITTTLIASSAKQRSESVGDCSSAIKRLSARIIPSRRSNVIDTLDMEEAFTLRPGSRSITSKMINREVFTSIEHFSKNTKNEENGTDSAISSMSSNKY
jgi:hypothetical protein